MGPPNPKRHFVRRSLFFWPMVAEEKSNGRPYRDPLGVDIEDALTLAEGTEI
jgi:hypothetical protein